MTETCGLVASGTSEANPRLKARNRTAVGTAVCTLIGDLDLHTRRIAESAFRRALSGRPPVFCVDLREVHFCDSSGLNLLLAYRARCAAAGAAMALVAPSARVGRLLELTDAETLFPVFPDHRSAAVGLRQACVSESYPVRHGQ
ncbi:STAS domain-containing protein [Streptacidiphilus anmyonensis]|uniref:STAS domain-containing protein n=1 Tax=Streptacidiphilus anmyonensis TaxID=405782 RepID=UPI00069399A6|nr:STAS domain-containing protein [Streptacidiphilus anmyonensis]